MTEQEFRLEVRKLGLELKMSDDLQASFFNHWTQENEKGKMGFQLEKTWNTKKRLKTWINNDKKWSKSKPIYINTQQQQKIDENLQFEAELKKREKRNNETIADCNEKEICENNAILNNIIKGVN